MSAKRSLDSVRTWIEIDSRAARKNYDTFRGLIGKKVKLWAVVKSNAYGHGLFAFSRLVAKFGIDGLCVDSLVEGIALRKNGIKKPILVLGHTLPSLYDAAAKHNITIMVSSPEGLQELSRAKVVPAFHIKIDTGMHRHGFYVEDLPGVIRKIAAKKDIKTKLTGLCTHFSSAKDINYPTYTDQQFAKFQKAIKLFEKAGMRNLMKHAAATGGTLINPKYHLDAVRVGIGLYGLWPSKELEIQLGAKIKLRPVLSWRTVVGEIKKLKKGDYVGYDMAERVVRDMKMAVIPIGYWHGFPRALSSVGEAIVNGKRARVLGRVSMDVVALGLTGPAQTGDVVTLIGKDGKEEIFAWEPSQKTGTTYYEFVTRLNPLMERRVV